MVVLKKINWKNESKNKHVTNLLLRVCFMSWYGFRDNIVMFKRSEAHDVEEIAYLHSINVSVEKVIFENSTIR